MKYTTKGVLLVLAVFFSMIAAQAPMAAETTTVDGIIQGISTRPNIVVVDETEVYGVSFKKLEMYNIFLDTGEYASFDVYEYICSSGEVKLMAYSVTVGDVTVVLRAIP